MDEKQIFERNRQSIRRLHALAARLGDAELVRPVGEHWTVAVAFAHLGFWDRRVLFALEATGREGVFAAPHVDLAVNDILLPFWRALPPRDALRLGLEAADQVDSRLEKLPRVLLESIHAANERFVIRALHRATHLDEMEIAVRA